MVRFYVLDRRIVVLIIFNILGVPSFVFVMVAMARSSSVESILTELAKPNSCVALTCPEIIQ